MRDKNLKYSLFKEKAAERGGDPSWDHTPVSIAAGGTREAYNSNGGPRAKDHPV
jgi:hypothetical protein